MAALLAIPVHLLAFAAAVAIRATGAAELALLALELGAAASTDIPQSTQLALDNDQLFYTSDAGFAVHPWVPQGLLDDSRPELGLSILVEHATAAHRAVLCISKGRFFLLQCECSRRKPRQR